MCLIGDAHLRTYLKKNTLYFAPENSVEHPQVIHQKQDAEISVNHGNYRFRCHRRK